MKQFKLYWLDGGTDIIEGESFVDACKNFCLGQGALRGLYHYEEMNMPPTQERFGGCPFCQQTTTIVYSGGQFVLAVHDNYDGQRCNASLCEPEGITK